MHSLGSATHFQVRFPYSFFPSPFAKELILSNPHTLRKPFENVASMRSEESAWVNVIIKLLSAGDMA